MDGLFLLIGLLPIVAVGFLIAALVMSFVAQTPAARRGWLWTSAGCLTLLLGGCALVIFGMTGLAY